MKLKWKLIIMGEFLALFYVLYLLDFLDFLLEKYSDYKIAIIATSPAVLVILIYIGNRLAMKVKYRYIELFLGSLFLLVIAVTYVAKQNIVPVNKLIYIEIIVFLSLLFGWIIGKMPGKR